MTTRTLYLCYFGIHEPLVQTQVLPYLRALAQAGIKVDLLTFEPRYSERWGTAQIQKEQQHLASDNISWFALPYHKRLSSLATAYDILAGAWFAIRRARSEHLDVLHARAHIPMAMALIARKLSRVKLIFDVRGLMADEYRDAGIWTERSLPFRLVKRLERMGLERADLVIVLTDRLRAWFNEDKLKNLDKVQVIPCCVDFARFNAMHENASNPQTDNKRLEIVYTGSLSGLYLTNEMIQFFKVIKSFREGAFLRLFSMTPPEETLAMLSRAGIKEVEFEVRSVSPEDMACRLTGARLGLSFRKPAFAQIAASPTKIPEYLAAGIPVVCTAGVGDMDELIESERVGVVIRELNQDSYHAAAVEALKLLEDGEIKARCRRVAQERFDLITIGGPRYVDVYRRLNSQPK